MKCPICKPSAPVNKRERNFETIGRHLAAKHKVLTMGMGDIIALEQSLLAGGKTGASVPIRLFPDTHRELKVLAAQRGQTLNATVADLLRASHAQEAPLGEPDPAVIKSPGYLIPEPGAERK